MGQETVLITGAGGFIGSNLVDDQLARGRQVVALDVNLDRLKHLANNAACRLVKGDIRDRELLARLTPGVGIVFHLASAHLEVSKAESYFWDVNVNAVKYLLQLAHDNSIHRFVHCSSVGVYGPLDKLPADEKTECHPEILYEETKLEGERIVYDLIRANGLSAVILRPAWVYGPHCPRTLRLFRTIKKKRFFMVGRGDNFRHPVYITDMLQAFELAATKEGIEGEAFIIASDEQVRLRELVDEIIRVQKLVFHPITLPVAMMKIVTWSVESVFKIVRREPPFSTRSLKFFTESSGFDIAKAKNVLGYQPKISLNEGLEETFRYYQAQNLL